MMWQWHNSNWWWLIAMPLGMLAFWALVAWAVVTIVRGNRATPPAAPPTNAERILADARPEGPIVDERPALSAHHRGLAADAAVSPADVRT